jgi:hypothetical protein
MIWYTNLSNNSKHLHFYFVQKISPHVKTQQSVHQVSRHIRSSRWTTKSRTEPNMSETPSRARRVIPLSIAYVAKLLKCYDQLTTHYQPRTLTVKMLILVVIKKHSKLSCAYRFVVISSFGSLYMNETCLWESENVCRDVIQKPFPVQQIYLYHTTPQT